MQPQYDFEKIKLASDAATYNRACELYANNKVAGLRADGDAYFATVQGSHTYDVIVSARCFDHGSCTCYLGQHDTLCKHMVAVAMAAALDGKSLDSVDTEKIERPTCSGNRGELTSVELANTKKDITRTLRYIKYYTGLSRTWFAYQGSPRGRML